MNYIGVVVFAIEGCSSLVKSSKLKAKDACESLVNWSSCDSARLPSSSHLTMSIKPKKLTPAALRVCEPKISQKGPGPEVRTAQQYHRFSYRAVDEIAPESTGADHTLLPRRSGPVYFQSRIQRHI